MSILIRILSMFVQKDSVQRSFVADGAMQCYAPKCARKPQFAHISAIKRPEKRVGTNIETILK